MFPLGSMRLLNSSPSSVVKETPLVEWKYSRDFALMIRRTSGYSEPPDYGNNLMSFWVIATGQVDFADLAR